jgi:type VI secretion system protein ImpM
MPDARAVTGLYGKVPAHGDFVRRGLPSSFVSPWDAWLQDAVAAAREALGPGWEDAWDHAPAWRFALPAGACGPEAVAGVMLPSQDTVGRRFPVTLAALLPAGAPMPVPAWFDRVEAAALAGRAGAADADALLAAIPDPAAREADFPPALAAVPAPTAAMPPVAGPGPAPTFWGAAEAPGETGGDVLALLAGSAPAAPAASPPDDVLGFFSAPPARGAEFSALPARDAEFSAPPARGAEFSALPARGAEPPEADPLALLMQGAAATPDTIDAIVPGGGADDPLVALIGAGSAGGADAFAPPQPEVDAPDPLAALIGAGAGAASEAAPGDVLAPLAEAIDPPPIEDAAPASPAMDPLPPPAFEPLDLPDASPADNLAPVAAVPPAPEQGGWWTRGAARLPPMVWGLPALPAPVDFACLLEARA